MRKVIGLSVVMLTLVIPAAAGAQSTSGMPAGGHVFISVNGLGQAGDGEVITQSQSLNVYGETATLGASQPVSLAAGLIDFGGGLRTNRFGLGLAFSASKNTDSAVAFASVPHPFLFNRPRSASTTIDALEHTERVLHLQAYYFVPIVEKAEIGLFIGPSFYDVTQDYVSALGAFAESSSFDTVTVPAARATASDSQVGFNVGAEATYQLTPNVGAALLLRFSRASAELDLGGQPLTLNVGDVQFGGGIRLRF